MKDEKKTRLLLLAAGLLFLCLVLAVSLAFCAGGNKPRIGICLRQNQEQSEYTSLLKEQMQEAGYRVSTVSAENDQSRQTECDPFCNGRFGGSFLREIIRIPDL